MNFASGRGASLLVAAATVLVVGGCAGETTTRPRIPAGVAASGPPATPGQAPTGGTGAFNIPPGPPLPDCVTAGPQIAPPPGFPLDFPIPPGSVLTTARTTIGGGAYVDGYAPGTLAQNAQFFTDALPANGYTLGQGDAETNMEAESTFIGNGVTGRWIVAALVGCENAVAIAIATIPSQ